MGVVSQKPSLERVIVIPRNGYLNRIQAWASASILAAEYDVPIRVLWEQERIAPADPHALFDPTLVHSTFIDRSEVDELLGREHESLPRYLTRLPDLGVVVLAGHDRGEQVFMGELEELIDSAPWLRALIIIAGGRFHLASSDDFTRQREVFYRQLRWSQEIDARVAAELEGRGSFNALHLRGTDHALSAPTRHQVNQALTELRASSDLAELFIAADSAETLEFWTATTHALGFQPWSASRISRERTSAGAGVDALVDWRLLSNSQCLVFSAVSTFAEEAAVASGHRDLAIALTASPTTQRVRVIKRRLASLVTYPRRKLARR